MSIIWILVIIAVAAAPLVSALPTEAQRYEARIRDHAMQSGLLVKLETPPDVPARFRVRRDIIWWPIDYGVQLPSLYLRRACLL